MATPSPTSRDPRQFATPQTPHVQNENTVDAAVDPQDSAAATRTDSRDDAKQQQAALDAKPEQNTSELPEPGEAGKAVDTPPVDPYGDAPHGETLASAAASVSPQTEQRIERDLAVAAITGEVPPRSTIAPAKPARAPNEDEQRMAEDFDPPPLAHRADLGR